MVTTSIDHRGVADIWDIGTKVKPAFANFIKELTKDWSHLPTLSGKDTVTHYVNVHNELAQRGADAYLISNVGRLLRANGVALDASDEHDALHTAPNFNLMLGDRGAGDIVYGAPLCYRGKVDYVPGTMDDLLFKNLAVFMR